MGKVTKEIFIKRAIEKHGNKYDYSLIEYKDCNTKVKIICPIHGVFEQTPKSHLKGYGCAKCSGKKMDLELFNKKAKEVHKEEYDYSKVKYINSYTKVCIICPKHGEFWQTPHSHLQGQRCPTCYGTKKLTTKEFIKKAKEVHKEEYDYSKVKYINSYTKVCIICPKHGEFWQTPSDHLMNVGCPICYGTKKLTTKEFIEKAKKVHKEEYNYTKVDYVNNNTKVCIVCSKHGEFWQTPSMHLQGQGCFKCTNSFSKAENEIYEYLKKIIGEKEIIQRSHSIIPPLELDLYLPNYKMAIEYDGIFWHNEINKEKDYHLNKTIECEKKGIRLFHIFEDEWCDPIKQVIIKSMIKNILGCTENKIYARKCYIRKINSSEYRNFIEVNHLQGYCTAHTILGLYYNDKLVSVMAFSKTRHFIGNNKFDTELVRFCNKVNTNVVGGASKLFNYYINEHTNESIVSYADRRWSNGNLYEKLGFDLYNTSKPNYYYVIGKQRKNRFKFRKSELVKKHNCPLNMSEHEFCFNQGWYRIYDCGCLCYKKNGKNTNNGKIMI